MCSLLLCIPLDGGKQESGASLQSPPCLLAGCQAEFNEPTNGLRAPRNIRLCTPPLIDLSKIAIAPPCADLRAKTVVSPRAASRFFGINNCFIHDHMVSFILLLMQAVLRGASTPIRV